MALKLPKLDKRQIAVFAVAGLAIVALLASRGAGGDDGPGTLDPAADRACSDFAAGYQRARGESARLKLADKVTASSGRTDNDAIADRAAEMGNAANETDAIWRSSSDALLKACRDAGWQS